MKIKQIIFAFLSASSLFLGSEAVLQKTEEEALKFLVDQGHITADATTQSFAIDRDGNIRLRVTDGNQIYSYGLQEVEDTYEITYMQRKKAPKTANSQSQQDQIARLIGQNLDILKGGEVLGISKAQGKGKRGDLLVAYKHQNKQYEINVNYNSKRGDLFIKSVKQKTQQSEL